jgi:hypothetical protein
MGWIWREKLGWPEPIIESSNLKFCCHAQGLRIQTN